MRIYLASSECNAQQPAILRRLRAAGNSVPDTRSPAQYSTDFAALSRADACVLLVPCTGGAHLAAGWAIGRGTPTAILLAHVGNAWDPMYEMAGLCTDDFGEIVKWLRIQEACGLF